MITKSWRCPNLGCDRSARLSMPVEAEVDELLGTIAATHAGLCTFATADDSSGLLDPLLYEMATFRRSVNRSQAAIAARMNTSQSAVSELETGTASPTLATLRRYCAALGFTVRAVPFPGDDEVSDAS